MREAFALLGFMAALILVVGVTGLLAPVIELFSADEDTARAIAAAILLVIGLAAGWIIGIRVTRDTPIPGPRWLDGLGGVAFALVRTLGIAALVLFCLGIAWGKDSTGHRMIADSVTGELLVVGDAPFGAFYDSLVKRSEDLESLVAWAAPDPDESPPAGFITTRELRPTDAQLTLRPAAERAMLAAINEERSQRGLDSLTWCTPCAEVARAHSQDMYRGGYFSHIDKAGNDPFDRMKAAEISYGAAGENLALAPTVTEAHEGLMRSPDHRANILRLHFDQVGIGIYEGPYGLLCTQVFRALPG